MSDEITPHRSTTTLILLISAILFTIFLLVLVPTMLRKSQAESNRYNGFDFVERDGFWYTRVEKQGQPYDLPFYYHPRELEYIGVETGLREKFFAMRDGGRIFISVDPDAPPVVVIAGVEIAKITGERYALLDVPTSSAFTREPQGASANTQTPIVACEDANPQTLVIQFVVTSNNLAYSDGNCVTLQSTSHNDSIKVADRLMYHLLGIMN